MKLAFDLISDLHIETWDQPFDWSGMATSMLCLVTGDVSKDRQVLIDTLTHLGECYRAVFYIDGNDEHRNTYQDLGTSYRTLAEDISSIPNVTYLQDNVVIVDGIAFLGTNGWWNFDFDDQIDYDETRQWFEDRYGLTSMETNSIEAMAFQDFAYLTKSVERLQKHADVKRIVLATHTVPMVGLIDHDVELDGQYRKNCTGNSHILRALTNDTENKVAAWCFGHYHSAIDRTIHGIRFVSNCRGRGDTTWKKSVYNPLRIEIDF